MPTEYDLATRDRHVRRDGDDYGQELLTYLPQGQAWPREPGSTLVNTLMGLAYTYGYVDGRAADLLERESDPRATTDSTIMPGVWVNGRPYAFGEYVTDPADGSHWQSQSNHTSPAHGTMADFRRRAPNVWIPVPDYAGRRDGLLSDWERAWGLPDPCFPKATTIAERQKMLVLYMTWLGGQSRAYFVGLMEYLGFTGLEVKEWAPFMAGVSHAGDTRPVKTDDTGNPITDGDRFVVDTTKQFRWYIGPPEMRFYWSINVGMVSVAWFRASSGQAGVDPHVRMGVPQDIQCLLNRWRPAHTQLVFDFSQSPATHDPMYGTP